jgi:hypothetical protein
MSAKAVTIREHIREALLAARPNGLSMAALAGTVTGPWRAREVEDAVRRLWELSELARRGDGTFVLTTKAVKEPRPIDQSLDDAVKRVAARARRSGHESTVRVRTVDPALLHAYCPVCRTQVTPRLDGSCVSCGTQTGANVEEPKPPPRRRRRHPLRQGQAGWGPVCPRCGGPKGIQAHTCHRCRKLRRGGYNRGRSGGKPVHIDEQLLAEARRLYAGGLSLRQVAAELHPRTGYKTAASCAEALYGHFKRRGWKLRPQREVTAARNHRHGRKPRGQTREQQNAYRRWLAEQRGWNAIQGPGRPLCKGVKKGPAGKGRPCRHHALADSEYCHSHDPRRALERQSTTARMRARVRTEPTVPARPFTAWLGQLHTQLGSWLRVGELTGMHATQANHYCGPHAPATVTVRVVERTAERAGTTLAALYGTAPLKHAA